MNNKKEYQQGIDINPQGNGSATCMRGKSCKDGCEFYDGGFCRGVCYPTYPPKYKRCDFENNGNAGQQYFTDEEINGFKGETNEPNRIEAAAERLLAQKTSKFEQPLNAAKMREALEAVKVAFDSGTIGPVGNYPPARLVAKAGKVMEMVEKALAAPARNCDVGATEEKN